MTLDDSNGIILLSPTRLYHAKLGRFLQRDFRKSQKPANLYGYAISLPTKFVDPKGDIIYFEGLSFVEENETRGMTRKQQQTLLVALEEATGLKLKLTGSSTKLQLTEDTERIVTSMQPQHPSSPFFAKFLKYLMNNKEIVRTVSSESIEDCHVDESTGKDRNKWIIKLNFDQVLGWRYFGQTIDLIFAHEIYHTLMEKKDYDRVTLESDGKAIFGTIDFVNVIAYERKLPLRLNYSLDQNTTYLHPNYSTKTVEDSVTQIPQFGQAKENTSFLSDWIKSFKPSRELLVYKLPPSKGPTDTDSLLSKAIAGIDIMRDQDDYQKRFAKYLDFLENFAKNAPTSKKPFLYPIKIP